MRTDQRGIKRNTKNSDLRIIFDFFRRNSEFHKKRKEVLISCLNSKKKTSNPDNNKNMVKNLVDFMKGKN
jgi:hypothetical protein